MAEGIAATAGTVTSAAVIMVSVFVAFGFIDRIEMKEVAVGLTAAVLFDAVVLRVLILPAALTLLGEHSWWRPTRTSRARDGVLGRPADPLPTGPGVHPPARDVEGQVVDHAAEQQS